MSDKRGETVQVGKCSTTAQDRTRELVLRLKAQRSVLARGVTLVEILIVLAIIAMIAGGVAVVAVPKLEQARVDTTKTNLRVLLPAAEMYRSNNAGECPTVQLLQQKKEISSTSETKDPWGSNYKIVCDEDDTRVVSFGKDKKENTPDDIVMPEQQKGE